MKALRTWCDRTLALIRQIAGMPDYDRYIEHLRRFHPERTALTREEYFTEYVTRRYQGGSRCC